MIRFIDNFLNSITMYRLVLYGLMLEAFIAILLGFLGIISYSGIQLIGSAILLTGICFIMNHFLAKLFKAPTNVESSFITALILFFILEPSFSLSGSIVLVLGGILAMASKYIFTIKKKHIFNPAAISGVLLGLIGIGNVSWWVATPMLLPVIMIVGLLFVRKMRRFQLFFSFMASAIISIYAFQMTAGSNPFTLFIELFTSWPLLFFATVMLTEPLTTPPTQRLRIIYGSLVGVLFGAQFQFGPIFSTPELAMVISNVFSYIVSPKQKLFFTLQEKIQLSPYIYDFIFTPNQKFTFIPGQYLEWTLPHNKPDSRGNRRYFTIASSPTEKNIHLGVRFNQPGSSFKKSLLSLHKSDTLVASQLAGDFTFPENANEKLVFIAGGIGITPFRSIIQYLRDTNQRRDIVLFYACTHPSELVYKDVFEKGKSIGLKTIYIITQTKDAPKNWSGKVGYITKQMIADEVKDYKNRKFYLSGPQAMVDAYKDLLAELTISKKNIITDYFPGF